MSMLTHEGALPPAVDAEIAVPGSANNLFWMLPGPSAFMDKVTSLFTRQRAVAVHLAERTVLGHHLLTDRALAQSHFDGAPPAMLRVHDASQIDCDIAQHLGDGRKHISPSTLAEWNTQSHQQITGQVSPHTFALRPRGAQALKAAWTYLTEFAKALPNSGGNTRLILIRVDNDPTWDSRTLSKSLGDANLDVAFFDGALSADEMRAYIGMRIALSGRAGNQEDALSFPMKRLTRSLVGEFAGFDAHFAEGLIRMSDEELLELPRTLGALASRLAVSDTVWRQASNTTVPSDAQVHTLYLWHLASHTGPHQKLAEQELNRKTWCAQLYSLMPWFEQLRHQLIAQLHPLLSAHLELTNGFKVRVNAYNGREFRTAIDDLECNDIASMARDDDPIRPRTTADRAALDLCSRVGRVRNEIAHMRPPQLQEIRDLISSLEAYRAALSRL